MTNQQPRVLTVIVSYNFEPWIERCLGSLQQSALPTDVVVIDNASTDRTVAILRERFRWVRLICSERNLGFGQANNIGMRLALEEDYDAVFLLNQDAWIEPKALSILAQLATEHPDFGVLSPTHLDGTGEQLDAQFVKYRQGKSPKVADDALLIEVPFVNAAFWYIPTAVLRKVGGFSPLFFHYGEDVDYVHRLQYHGYRVGYTPLTTGCHDRQERKTSREKQMNLDRIYFLTVLANPCSGGAKRFYYGVLAPLKPALFALCKGRWSEARFYLKASARLLTCYAYVMEVIESYKKGDALFLKSLSSKIKPIWN